MSESMLANKVKSLAISLGADLVGIASVDRFKEAPIMISPKGHLPTAQSVVVMAIHHPDAVVELGGEDSPHHQGPYSIQGLMNTKLDFLSFKIAKFLEDEGYESIPIPVTNIWRYRPYKSLSTLFTADLSQRHAAVAAGLGELGWSGLLLSPEYGPRQRITSVITNAPLTADPMYDGPPLCDRCDLCAEGCEECADALNKETKVFDINIGGKKVKYADKNMWRCSWSEHFGLDAELPKPDVVTEEVILATRKEHGTRGGALGYCLKFCMSPDLRVGDPDYTRVWRRARPFKQADEASKRDITERLKALCIEKGVDVVGIASEEKLAEAEIPASKFLPDGKTAVVIGIEYPSTYDGKEGPLGYIKGVIRTKLEFVSLDISSYLEKLGYSVLPRSGMPVDKAAIAAGFTPEESKRMVFLAVVTEAPLIAAVKVESAGADVRRKPVLNSDRVKHLALSLGANIVGIASVDRFKGIEGIKQPQEIMPGCKSVVVMGIHFPDATIERATEEPSEAVGPYSYAQYQTTWQLDYTALDFMRNLNSLGYSSYTGRNLFGASSTVSTARGQMPDAAVDRFSAVAAGLGIIGWNGAVLTPEYGPRQRFISVLTDIPLEPDPLYEGLELCDKCMLCVKACPLTALSGEEKVTVEIGGRTFEYGKLDVLRCDWAKKYAFIGDEGPKYMGSKADILPPDVITPEAIAEAVKKRDVVQEHWTCILEGCIRACLPPHLRMEDKKFCSVYRRKR